MEFHVRLQLERESHQVGRNLPGLREITFDFGKLVEIEAQQGRIERCREMQRRIGVAAMRIIMRRFGADGEIQRAALFRRLRIRGVARECKGRNVAAHKPSFLIIFVSP